jgi:hypothetical protein
VRGSIDIIQLMVLPDELMYGTKIKTIKQGKCENRKNNPDCTLILYHPWAEIELIHKIIIILSLSRLVRK